MMRRRSERAGSEGARETQEQGFGLMKECIAQKCQIVGECTNECGGVELEWSRGDTGNW